ncbi:MAG: hypothetical protein OEW15_04315 [Nitrospirota bacterium]|nr:hypothetical protein [Nitrospirota bacterium]
MRIFGKIILVVVVTLGLLVTGFALGFPIGMHRGFSSGSEWAMLEAKLAAREAGVVMPVYIDEDGWFHVVLRKQADDEGTTRKQPVSGDVQASTLLFLSATESGSEGSALPAVTIPLLARDDRDADARCVRLSDVIQ